MRRGREPKTAVAGVARWAREQAESYRHGADRPLSGYVALLGIYSGATLGAGLAARAAGRPALARVSPWDVAQLAMATHKVARLISKDPVTSPLRAPFTMYAGSGGPGELTEEVRAHNPFEHAVGELLTCPMCLAQWVATAFMFGLVLAPALTRTAIATLSAVTGADFLQYLYVMSQQLTTEDT